MNNTNNNGSKLTLGWNVTNLWEPMYWLNSKAKAGDQEDNQLIQVPSCSLACHTAIIAQSGSGKSFFLARLVEELLLNTKARCIILDPNADFKKAFEIEEINLWKKAHYDMHKRAGKLPHEKSKQDFADQWNNITIKIKSLGYKGDLNKNQEALKLDWPSVSAEFLAEDSDLTIKNELYHCHTFTESVYLLTSLKKSLNSRFRKNFINEAERLFSIAKALMAKDVSQAFSEFDETVLCKSKIALPARIPEDQREDYLA